LKTGFFPPEPLPHLSGIFHIWEEALEQAPEVLALAFNDSEDAMEKKEEGHQWRQKIRDVRNFTFLSV
jgi:indoleamine 2,3-dioxygenase